MVIDALPQHFHFAVHSMHASIDMITAPLLVCLPPALRASAVTTERAAVKTHGVSNVSHPSGARQ